MLDQVIAESIATRINAEAWEGAAEGKCAHELFPEITEDNEIARVVVTSLVEHVIEGHQMYLAGILDDGHMISTLEHGFIVAMAVGLEFGKVLAAETLGEFTTPDEYDGSDWN